MSRSDTRQASPISAVAYVRMSSDHQRFSVETQEDAIAAYARARGYIVVRRYADLGKSGLSLKGRHGLRNLLADSLRPERDFEAILVYDISRWGRFRDPDQAAYYEFLCRQAGISVHYCAEPFENDLSPMAGIWKNLKRVMAHEYSRELSERVARAKIQQARLGFKMGAPLIYGFRRLLCDEHGDPRFVLAPGQAKANRSDRIRFVGGPEEELEIIREIFFLYVRKGFSLESTARYLRDQDIPGNFGMPWTASMVRSVLGSELCVGRYVYNRSTSMLQTAPRKNPKHLWTHASTGMESIVPDSLFQEAQLCLAERKSTKLNSEELLENLRDLWKKQGRLSATLINGAPAMACSSTYKSHFGTLGEAYRRIGYVEPFCIDGWRHTWTREALRVDLRTLYDEHGYLTGNMIDKARSLPGAQVIQRKIGDMTAVYAFIGVPALSAGDTIKAAKAELRMRLGYSPDAHPHKKHFSQDYIINRLKALLDHRGYISAPLIKADQTLPSVTTIIERFGSVLAAYNAAGWMVERGELATLQLKRRYAAKANQ